MVLEKKLGIWMDHSNAHLMELSIDGIQGRTIASKFTHEGKEISRGKSENLMHNKEQHQQSEYYKELGNIIRGYDEVILFGPTSAKAELHNLLKMNHLFEKIKIETRQTDKMTESQRHAFVTEHFAGL